MYNTWMQQAGRSGPKIDKRQKSDDSVPQPVALCMIRQSIVQVPRSTQLDPQEQQSSSMYQCIRFVPSISVGCYESLQDRAKIDATPRTSTFQMQALSTPSGHGPEERRFGLVLCPKTWFSLSGVRYLQFEGNNQPTGLPSLWNFFGGPGKTTQRFGPGAVMTDARQSHSLAAREG